MLNKDLFYKDPTDKAHEIPNLGVAKIGRPTDDKAWATLRFELQHFVCEGQYEAGLERILSNYLAYMPQPEQPAFWVSGFYGSGKSHFLKVLDNLWNNTRFPDGATARGLTGLSDRVALQLTELENLGKREGGVWSAAGTLGAGASGSPRLAFLDILFGAAGLPQRYDAARLVMWMKDEGIESQVRDALAAQGREFEFELMNMYVSPHLAQALFDAAPGLAEAPTQILKLLDAQYKLKGTDKDITDQELITAVEQVLEFVAQQAGKPGKLPLTLIIMDELQQYIGDDAGRTLTVQNIVEALSSKFGSHILFAAAGQSAMGATPMLLKLQGRFTGRVEFTDTDVDRVVRQVVLRKAPDKVAFLDERLDQVSGEINRHLQGTKVGPTPEDSQTMVADYPLLPTRRRFWEHVLRAIDKGGSAAQLRTQLRSVQEATRFVGDMPVGVVVPGDFLYEQQVHGMLHSGVLSKDLHETIEALKDGSVDGGLKYRSTGLVFLIGQLNSENKELGVRASASTLADLLIANLNDGSAMLRTEVEKALAELADEGVLQVVDGEYSLQGKVGAEWQQEYTRRVNRIKDEAARIEAVRTSKIQQTLQSHIGNLAFVQGEARAPRKGQFVYGLEAPDLSTGQIPIWVRDEWTVSSLKAAETEAASRGSEDPVVHLLIPKRDAQAIKDEIVKLEAAQETLDAKGSATTEEGGAARRGMQARRDAAEERLRNLMADLLTDARVLMSGGNEIRESDLRASIDVGLRSAAQRMFPKFDVAEGNWGLVVRRASDGAGDALEALGYQGEPKNQKVCAEILKLVGSGAKRGSDVRDYFKSAPYGWPQDAVDGALMVLARGGDLKIQLNGQDALPFQVTQDKLGKFMFALEQQPFTAGQRLELRKLFSNVGVACKPNEEAEALASLLTQLVVVGQKAGGPAPLPPVPDLQSVRDLEGLSGNERLVAAWENRALLEQLWSDWRHAAAEVERRVADWTKLQMLVDKGASLPEAAEANEQMSAIEAARSALDDPDPIRPLITKMVDALRDALRERHAQYKAAREGGIAELEAVPEYKQLPAETWRKIVSSCGLGPLPELQLGTDGEVMDELNVRPLGIWPDLIEGMKGRIDKARRLLAEAAEPEAKIVAYTPPLRRLATQEDVDAYLDEVRAALLKAIESGSHVIIER